MRRRARLPQRIRPDYLRSSIGGSRVRQALAAPFVDQPIRRRQGALTDEGRRIVWEQKGLIARRRAAGLDVVEAEQILRLLEANLKTFEHHRNSLESKDN